MYGYNESEAYEYTRKTPPIVQSNAVAIPEGVNILPSRAGNADRDRAINHISQMADLGYVSPEEAERRIRHAENAERATDLKTLTSDLPAPLHNPTWYQSYDWSKPAYWVPTLIGGIATGGMLATIPPAVLAADNLFPRTDVGLVFALLSLITGVIMFFGCLAGIVVKSS